MDSKRTLGHKELVLSRHLPKTGQTTSYNAGDDGALQFGWVMGIDRFEIVDSNNLVFDKATGLLWARDGTGTGGNGGVPMTWAGALTWANALNWRGYTDWRLPNYLELISIMEFEKVGGPYIYDEFINIQTDYYWSSTTYITLTSQAYTCRYNTALPSRADKTTNYLFALAVRKGKQ